MRGALSLGVAAFAAGTLIIGAASAQQAQPQAGRSPAQQSPAAQTYAEIDRSLGQVPSFLRAFPESGIQGAWAEMRDVQMNPNTALPGKVKELIGLAVAAQVPCSYCVYFHTKAAQANGATEEEIREAVAMAAITRHWSTVLNGMQIDPAEFRQQTDAILRHAESSAATGGSMPGGGSQAGSSGGGPQR